MTQPSPFWRSVSPVTAVFCRKNPEWCEDRRNFPNIDIITLQHRADKQIEIILQTDTKQRGTVVSVYHYKMYLYGSEIGPNGLLERGAHHYHSFTNPQELLKTLNCAQAHIDAKKGMAEICRACPSQLMCLVDKSEKPPF